MEGKIVKKSINHLLLVYCLINGYQQQKILHGMQMKERILQKHLSKLMKMVKVLNGKENIFSLRISTPFILDIVSFLLLLIFYIFYVFLLNMNHHLHFFCKYYMSCNLRFQYDYLIFYQNYLEPF